MMALTKQLTHIFKYRWRRHGVGEGFAWLACRFDHLHQLVRTDPVQPAPLATSPGHLNRQNICQMAGAENAHGVIRREVSAATLHFLSLEGNCAAGDADASADATRVRRLAPESYGHARCITFIAINAGNAIHSIDDHVQ